MDFRTPDYKRASRTPDFQTSDYERANRTMDFQTPDYERASRTPDFRTPDFFTNAGFEFTKSLVAYRDLCIFGMLHNSISL